MHRLSRSDVLRTPALVALVALLASATWSPAARGSELRRSAIVRAVQQARRSIVNIHGQKTLPASDQYSGEAPRRVNGMGTGVVIDERGYIVTNHHVVQGVKEIQVTLADGETYVARLVSHDHLTDLAVIKIDAPQPLPVVQLGTSADLMPGETVIAVGNAYGYQHTVTRGIISALHRTVQVSDAQEYADLIQTDASINPGNSGGPLLNIDGDMIGLNVAVRAGAQGIGFAIPVDKVLDVAAGLMSVERIEKRWHGLSTRDTPDRRGVLVSDIESGSPAQRGGLRPGDLITTVANQRVGLALELERAMLGRGPENSVDITLMRKDRAVKTTLVLAASPEGGALQRQAWNELGLRLEAAPAKQLAQVASRYRGGLRVTEVRPEGPAAQQGIRTGDILVGMHIWETISEDNVAYILSRDLAEIGPLKFYIVRGRETLYGHLAVARSSTKRR